MKTYTQNEVLNQFIGKKGTPKRTKFENELNADLLAHSLKKIRLKQHLTQEQLAEKTGLDKPQISRIENGKANITLATINRIAAGLNAKINFEVQLL